MGEWKLYRFNLSDGKSICLPLSKFGVTIFEGCLGLIKGCYLSSYRFGLSTQLLI